MSEEPMAAGRPRLSSTESPAKTPYELRLVPLPIEVARRILAGKLRTALRPQPVGVQLPSWHPQYPLPDSVDAIAMVFAAHEAVHGATGEPPAWWIHQMVVDGVVVGDIGFHGPPGPERTVEIGYSVVPAWRRRGVATRACNLILQQAWQDGAEIVVAETDHDNVASQKVLLSNGFRQGSDGIFMIERPEAR
jgi:[ribosomal protein S5]-alanine N-acetyltransferase